MNETIIRTYTAKGHCKTYETSSVPAFQAYEWAESLARKDGAVRFTIDVALDPGCKDSM